VISSKNLPQDVVDAFVPMSVTGDYNLFGPVLFINNEIECIVVSVLNDKVDHLSTIVYEFANPG
jgi:hypothetical protein